MVRVVLGCYQHDGGGSPTICSFCSCTGWRRRVSHRVEAEGAATQMGVACLAFIEEDLGLHRKELPARCLAYWLPSLVTPALPCGGLVETVRLEIKTESGGISGMGSGEQADKGQT